MAKLCDFGKEIKKRLVDIDKNQEWLIARVRDDTGLYFDSSYLYKVLVGNIATPSILASICKILGINEKTQKPENKTTQNQR